MVVPTSLLRSTPCKASNITDILLYFNYFLLIDLVGEVCTKTGIIIEPVYTGKSVYHLLRLTKEQPELIKGNKILFIHTGGLFGHCDGRMYETVKQMGTERNKIHEWMELSDQAPDLNL